PPQPATPQVVAAETALVADVEFARQLPVDLPAEGSSLVDEHAPDAGPRGLDRGCDAGRPTADDDERPYLGLARAPRSGGACFRPAGEGGHRWSPPTATVHAPLPRRVSTWRPSRTGVRHARAARCPSKVIMQSKQTPMPQYIPRGSPRSEVTRKPRW